MKLRRPSSGLIVAIIALVVAMSGSAFAASLITSKQIKDGTIALKDIDKKALAQLKGKTGPQGGQGAKGNPGAQGPQGAKGDNGAPGQPGSPAASVFTSRFTNNALTQTLFGPVTGIGPVSNTDESAVSLLSPAAPIVARDLFAQYANDAGSAYPGATRAFTLRVNGVDTALTCTFTRPATSCSNTGDAVTIPAGSLLSIKFFQAGAIGSGSVIVAWRGTTP